MLVDLCHSAASFRDKKKRYSKGFAKHSKTAAAAAARLPLHVCGDKLIGVNPFPLFRRATLFIKFHRLGSAFLVIKLVVDTWKERDTDSINFA